MLKNTFVRLAVVALAWCMDGLPAETRATLGSNLANMSDLAQVFLERPVPDVAWIDAASQHDGGLPEAPTQGGCAAAGGGNTTTLAALGALMVLWARFNNRRPRS